MADDEVIKKLASYQFTVPKGGDKVYKDECIYCYDTPISHGGIYVCLSTLLAVSQKYLKIHVERCRKTIFLNLRKIPQKVTKTDNSPPEKKITKLAIGVEGGFDVNQDKVEYEDVNSLVVTDDSGNEIKRFSLPDSNLPLNAQLSIAAVVSHQGANLQSDIQAWEEKRIVSKHAENLKQLDNGVKIPPRGWKCTLCDLTQNLWLNLTDGAILCGRRYFDGTGGNNHAVEYYERTKYPLAVKLGTITADGGDVYSYDEDDMVEDPKLKEHLQHFGINISQLEKTEKTMTELEIEANLSIKAEWDLIQEAGKKLVPLYGPGYTGMINLGNSCYMNSLMQVLFSMQEFQKQYNDNALQIFCTSVNPVMDFKCQMAKLAAGLASGCYSEEPTDGNPESLGVRPQMLKTLIGRGHPEFSTSHQQDVHEYFLHVIDLIEKDEKNSHDKIKNSFLFQFEDRIQCCSSNKVTYKKKEDLILQLPIPLDAATNKDEYERFVERKKQAEDRNERIHPESVVRLKVPLSACIKAFSSAEAIADYHSTAIKGKTNALKQTRFHTFPDYLVIQLRKFKINDDWTPAKLDVSVDMTDELDLSHLRSTGIQATEELLPEEEEETQNNEPTINEEYVGQLVDMGFPLEACKKAVHFTNNQGVEAAMNWVFEHSQDPDFASPLQIGNQPANEVDEASVAMIVSMGFSEARAKTALKNTQNNVEAAAEWIFTHMDTDEEDSAATDDTPAVQDATCRDGPGKYRLFAFISHMGTSTSCGHYVCHILKNDRWVIFNDRKVALSENPPKDLGYLYFYKRIES